MFLLLSPSQIGSWQMGECQQEVNRHQQLFHSPSKLKAFAFGAMDFRGKLCCDNENAITCHQIDKGPIHSTKLM